MRRGTITGAYMVTEQADGRAIISTDEDGEEVVVMVVRNYDEAQAEAAYLRDQQEAKA
jgi:hypothetical protein